MLSSFIGQKQVTTTHTAFCNYLALEVEGLEEKDFQTFRNKAVKLHSTIQSKAEECGYTDVFKPFHQTHSADQVASKGQAAAMQRAANFLPSC